jgi:hypothetical protein
MLSASEGGAVMFLRNLFFIVLCVLTFGLVGCGDDDANDQVTNIEEPLNSPTPTPAPQQAWSVVHLYSNTDMVTQDTCDQPFHLRIERDGDYRAGPCTSGGNDFKTGRITNEERMELDQRARAVAAQNLNDQTCTNSGAIAGSHVQLVTPTKNVVVYRNDPGKYCYRGTEAAAKDLHEYLYQLQALYYPTRAD